LKQALKLYGPGSEKPQAQ